MRAAIALLIACALAYAVPAPTEIIVNDATMECSSFSRGDECISCAIPEGWVSLGYRTVSCPEGYTEVTAPRNCTASSDYRCCSEGHSGAPGDCGDMYVSHWAKECTFTNVSGLKEWEGKPEGMPDSDWLCPADYTWVEGMAAKEWHGCCIPSILLSGLAIMLVIKQRLIPWERARRICRG